MAAISATSTKAKYPVQNRKYWVWEGRSDKASESELKAKYQKIKSHGIHGVFLEGGLNEREFALIREAGLELHSWMWTTNRGEQYLRDHHPDWYMVSRSGKSCFDHPPYVDYYRWISPVIPGVQDYLSDRVEELAAHPAVHGVHLDYVRYPDVILPRALWEKYKLVQNEELADYDFCYSDHTRKAFKDFCGRDPLEIEDPAHDQQWLHFRYDSVTHLVKKLAGVARGKGKKITAAVFPTPHMARKICRQDWDKFPLDAFCPMTYHAFYNEGIDWIGDCVLENIQSVSAPIYAGLYMPDMGKTDDFKRAIHVALHNGAAGVSLFGGVNDTQWAAFEEAIA
jgi:Glycosyl hydrolase-like 10